MSAYKKSRRYAWMKLILAVTLTLSVCGLPQAVFATNELNVHQYFSNQSGNGFFRYFMPGVIRQDQGTMEFTVNMSKPHDQTGGTWDFLFTSAPTKLIGTSSNTLMALYMPQAASSVAGVPAVPKGLIFSMRTDQATNSSVNYVDFNYTVGEKMNIAVSWGSELRIYINGVLKANAPFTAPYSDAVMPYMFTIEDQNPYYPEQVKISTRERTASELVSSPAASFTADSDTSLLVNNQLKTIKRVLTNWQKNTNYSSILPALREDTQTYVQGQDVKLPFVTVNYGDIPRYYEVEVTAKNESDDIVITKQFPITVAADRKYHIEELPLSELNLHGFYKLTTTWHEVGGSTFTKDSSIVVVPPDNAAIPDGKLENYLGFHHLQEIDPSIINKLDIKSARSWGEGEPFTWFNIETVPGVFDWSDSDQYVANMKAAGLDILPVLGYPPTWAADPNLPAIEILNKDSGKGSLRPDRWKPRSMEEWGNYVYQIVNRYKNDIKHWEIWNEVNFQPPNNPAAFSGTTADYLEMLNVAYQKAKEADPDSLVLTSGFSDNTSSNLSTPLQAASIPAGSTYDILNVHGYQGIGSAHTQSVLNQYQATRPEGKYWMTEYGPLFESFQFDRLYKLIEYPIQFLEKGFERFYLFSEYSLFINRHTLSPTIDYSVVGVLQNNLRKAESFEGVYTFPNDTKFTVKHQFKRTDDQTLSILGSKTGEYEVTVTGTPSEVTDMFGKPVAVTTVNGISQFKVKGVVYVISAAPLVITNAQTTSTIADLIYNGGFESPLGDVGADPDGVGQDFWTYHETDFDANGNIAVSTSKRSGSYAMEFTSSGNKVNMDQVTEITQPGRYQIKAFVKLVSGNAAVVKPYVFVNNPNADVPVQELTKANPTTSYTSITLPFEVIQTPVQPIKVGTGILSGAGVVDIDDFEVTYLGPN
ncbi:hypothetical protein GC096_36000 [Paenibacillus sp. LMG 31461]|uniref:Uncharacterized protein n=1 Tax=Paenibacillus plantarum TaxID=2654975 RepID=A0ABX1XNM3_9BACL|nr:hypothetical protein [Paenibacillus plantarum]NOU69424.1 hypothetical protein [Paenibacillus plantarum]